MFEEFDWLDDLDADVDPKDARKARHRADKERLYADIKALENLADVAQCRDLMDRVELTRIRVDAEIAAFHAKAGTGHVQFTDREYRWLRRAEYAKRRFEHVRGQIYDKILRLDPNDPVVLEARRLQDAKAEAHREVTRMQKEIAAFREAEKTKRSQDINRRDATIARRVIDRLIEIGAVDGGTVDAIRREVEEGLTEAIPQTPST